ncbi:MAG: nucleotidyl transferase AbiEii/AbiGii toxin family protein [Opitutaceae bacterium]
MLDTAPALRPARTPGPPHLKGGTSLSKVWGIIQRFSEDIDVSLSRDWLGATGERDPECAGTGKQRRKRLDDLSAACAQRIQEVVLPRLRESVAATLETAGWSIAPAETDAQTLLFQYPSALDQGSPSPYR